MAGENGERYDVFLQTYFTPEQAEALRGFAQTHNLSISGVIRGLALHQLGHLLNHHKPRCPSCGEPLTWRIKGTKRMIGKSILGSIYTCSCKWWSPVDEYLEGVGRGEPHLGNDGLSKAR
ncbi:MAG: hypothetical protein V3U52_07545 [Thermoplasmata archaeon]